LEQVHEDPDAENGWVRFDHPQDPKVGAMYTRSAGQYKVDVTGTVQTQPGKKPLYLTLSVGGKVLARTDPFYVAAIPIAVRFTGPKKFTGNEPAYERNAVLKTHDLAWGVAWQATAVSDSGNAKDLDQVTYAETIVVKTEGNNALKKYMSGGFVGDFHPADGPIADLNAIGESIPWVEKGKPISPQDALKAAQTDLRDAIAAGDDTAQRYQYFVFADARTGMTQKDALIIDQSGFLLGFAVTKDNKGNYLFTVRRTPAKVQTANPGLIDPALTGAMTVSI
jgi:hypothetical protein